MPSGRPRSTARSARRCAPRPGWRRTGRPPAPGGQAAPSPVVVEVDAAGPMFGHQRGRHVGLDPPVVDALGQAHDVGGEAVATHVRRLPHVGRRSRRQRPHDRPTQVGAARVVAPVRAHQVEGRRTGPADAGGSGKASTPRSTSSSRPGSAAGRSSCSTHHRSTPEWARNTRRTVWSGGAPVAGRRCAGRAAPAPGGGGPRRRAQPPPSGRGGSPPGRPLPHAPGCSITIHRCTREAVPTIGSSRASDSVAQRSASGSGIGARPQAQRCPPARGGGPAPADWGGRAGRPARRPGGASRRGVAAPPARAGRACRPGGRRGSGARRPRPGVPPSEAPEVGTVRRPASSTVSVATMPRGARRPSRRRCGRGRRPRAAARRAAACDATRSGRACGPRPARRRPAPASRPCRPPPTSPPRWPRPSSNAQPAVRLRRKAGSSPACSTSACSTSWTVVASTPTVMCSDTPSWAVAECTTPRGR